MKLDFVHVLRVFAATIALLAAVLLPGAATAMPTPGKYASAQGKAREMLAAPQRANKSRIRSGVHWGLQRSARRAGKQSGAAVAKTVAPEVLAQLRQVIRALRSEGSRNGRAVSAAAQRAVACIEANPGIQVGGLARELGIHQSTASNLLERLTREGLVAKRRTVDDQRTVSLYATAKGRTALKSAPPPGDRLQRALARLPASSLAALNGHLKDLIRAIPA
jgi:DNA-binding MarR family transcriptional regulator